MIEGSTIQWEIHNRNIYNLMKDHEKVLFIYIHINSHKNAFQ